MKKINTGVPKAAKGEPDNALPRETEPPLDGQSTQVCDGYDLYLRKRCE